MAEEGANEKLSIRNSGRSLKKYGSTSSQCQSHIKPNVNLVKHEVLSTDTLQGIALKYSVTTEQIRRANRLWASDSLFLREHLMIPVAGDAPSLDISLPVGDSSNSQNVLPVATSIDSDLGDNSIDEFLGKIDSSIAFTKKEVKKCQGNSEFLTDVDCGYERRKPAVSRMKQSANNNISVDPHAVVMTQTKKVRTSLQRMEQQQDEIFEL